MVRLFTPAQLGCVLGDYASVRTISEYLRACNLTPLSISGVFTGGEHQGEYLDKTIDWFCGGEI